MYTLKLLIATLAYILAPRGTFAIDATLLANCDNHGTLYRSDDHGSTWTTLVTESEWQHWTITHTEQLADVTSATIVKATCRDVGYIGGFIARMTVNGDDYVTTSPIDAGLWSITSSYTDTLTYRLNGEWPWYSKSSAVGANAYWIWNNMVTWNELDFVFDFADVFACGGWGKANNHACLCKSSCSGDYCSNTHFVTSRLRIEEPDQADLCYETAEPICCCSCKKCGNTGGNWIQV